MIRLPLLTADDIEGIAADLTCALPAVWRATRVQVGPGAWERRIVARVGSITVSLTPYGLGCHWSTVDDDGDAPDAESAAVAALWSAVASLAERGDTDEAHDLQAALERRGVARAA